MAQNWHLRAGTTSKKIIFVTPRGSGKGGMETRREVTDPRAWSQENFGRNQLGTKASEQMENIKEARTREPGEGGGGGQHGG